MLIGLRGSFTTKAKGKRWDNPGAWQKKRLYLDLLVDPQQLGGEDDEEDDIEYPFGFQFLEKQPVSGQPRCGSRSGRYWIVRRKSSLRR